MGVIEQVANTMMFKVVATLLLALAVADANQKCDRVRARLAALATDCSNDCPNISNEDRDLVTAAEKLACPDYCMFSKANLLDADGKPSKAKFEELFDGVPRAQRAVGNCYNKANDADDRQMG